MLHRPAEGVLLHNRKALAESARPTRSLAEDD